MGETDDKNRQRGGVVCAMAPSEEDEEVAGCVEDHGDDGQGLVAVSSEYISFLDALRINEGTDLLII